jgi:hypothetical protein
MSRIKIIAGASLSILALSALGISTPVASAKSPCKSTAECFGVLVEGVHLPVHEGDPLNIVSEGVVTFTGKNLVVNCPQGQLNGSIIVVRGNLQASISGASFGGAGGCSSSTGPASVSGGPTPGMALTQTLKTNGKSQLSGGLELNIGLDGGAMSCSYSAKSIRGAYNTDEEPIDLELPRPPKFKIIDGSSAGCPKTGTLSPNVWSVNAGSPATGEGALVFVG